MTEYKRFTPPALHNACFDKKTRIGYIDAARGFVMLIVVFQHVRAFGLNLLAEDSLLSFIYLYFFLSTFFLLSGYLSERVLNVSTFLELFKKVIAKFKALIIPTALFFVIYKLIASRNESMGPWSFPGGYWFTYVLFIISALTITVAYIVNKIHASSKVIWILLLLSFIMQFARIVFPDEIDSGVLYVLRTRQTCTYFLFFIIGILIKRNENALFKIFETQWFRTCLIGGTFSIYILRYSMQSDLSRSILVCSDFIISIVSSIAIFVVFHLTNKYWQSDVHISNGLKLIGRKSLDIYMLHYFFIPALPLLGTYFRSDCNSAIEIVVVGSISLLVVALCIFTSKIISLAPPLYHLLFCK